MSSISFLVPSPTLPVTVAAAMKYARIDNQDEADVVQDLVRVGWRLVEDYTGRALIRSTYRYVNPIWPVWRNRKLVCFREGLRSFILNRTPLVSVEAVKCYDENGVQQTLPVGSYSIDTDSVPGRVNIKATVDLPSLDATRTDAVVVDFTAGPTEVDPVLSLAVKMFVVHFYDNPAPVITGTITAELPISIKHLLRSMRVESSFES